MSGASPGILALRRLVGDRLALISFLVVVAITAACVAAPWLSPCPPDQGRVWLGALPPGASHPDVRERNVLAVGMSPVLTVDRIESGRIEVAVRRAAPPEDYLLQLRQGRLRIMREAGAEQIPALDPAGAEIVNHPLRRGPLGATAPLRAGEAPPPGLFAPGERVLQVRIAPPAVPSTVAATVVGGLVTTLTVDGRPATTAAMAGEQVDRVLVDGRERILVHPLGTDLQGRDMLARVLHGGRISLLVGIIATLVSVVIGTLYGATAAWLGGRADRLMMGAVDVLYALPFLLLVILLLVLFGRSLLLLFAALGAVQWLTQARIVRAAVLSLTARDFVTAARAAGIPGSRIVVRHLLPNCTGVIIAYGALTVPMVIMEESFLAFIGLGVQAGGVDSWGGLISAGAGTIGQADWMLIAPAATMVLLLTALTVLGDRLRDVLDPRQSR
jgi:oligopeptide transport system permease protein